MGLQQVVEIARLNEVLKEHGIADTGIRKSICCGFFFSQAVFYDQGSLTHNGRQYRPEIGLSEGVWNERQELVSRERVLVLTCDADLHDHTLGLADWFFDQCNEVLRDVDVSPALAPEKRVEDRWLVEMCFASGLVMKKQLYVQDGITHESIQERLREVTAYTLDPRLVTAGSPRDWWNRLRPLHPDMPLCEMSAAMTVLSRVSCQHSRDWHVIARRVRSEATLRRLVGTCPTIRDLGRVILEMTAG